MHPCGFHRQLGIDMDNTFQSAFRPYRRAPGIEENRGAAADGAQPARLGAGGADGNSTSRAPESPIHRFIEKRAPDGEDGGPRKRVRTALPMPPSPQRLSWSWLSMQPEDLQHPDQQLFPELADIDLDPGEWLDEGDRVHGEADVQQLEEKSAQPPRADEPVPPSSTKRHVIGGTCLVFRARSIQVGNQVCAVGPKAMGILHRLAEADGWVETHDLARDLNRPERRIEMNIYAIRKTLADVGLTIDGTRTRGYRLAPLSQAGDVGADLLAWSAPTVESSGGAGPRDHGQRPRAEAREQDSRIRGNIPKAASPGRSGASAADLRARPVGNGG